MATLLRRFSSFRSIKCVFRDRRICKSTGNIIYVRAPLASCRTFTNLHYITRHCSSDTQQKRQQSTDDQINHDEDEGQESEMNEDEIRLTVLTAALEFVPEHGWTTHSLVAGAENEGLPGISHGMFARGPIELVEFFYKRCNQRLADRLSEEAERQKEDCGKINITQFIKDALKCRLMMMDPYMDSWSQAMGLQALPQNAPQSWKNLLDLTDDIWHHAGDTASDFNWYTKRLSLAYVYKSTEVYMLQDESEHYQDTWKFMDNRLNDIKTVGKTISQSQSLVGTAFDLMKAAATVGINMSGLNKHDGRAR